MSSFVLDPRLAADSHPVSALPLCELRLIDDARFPWLILVPRIPGVSEIIDLDEDRRSALFAEIVAVSGALRSATGCDKLNVAAIGNIVAQLHVHAVARFRGDAAWPRPVWGFGEKVAYDKAERDRLVEKILTALPA
ncbi:MAG TPA: HIT family protein [Bauldia sp.]|nr:HIT family protein [Bauldia sp.]